MSTAGARWRRLRPITGLVLLALGLWWYQRLRLRTAPLRRGLAVLLADVSGHGFGPAILAAAIRSHGEPPLGTASMARCHSECSLAWNSSAKISRLSEKWW